ncbi:hypothetical protein H4582DRAFT_1908159 [Lactarius indigo]|nr:hypothetical protein H4582DRAFT_1908159 [Lactarius indigo]
MSSVNTVTPANTLVGSANERTLDAPSRPWCRFMLTVNLWPSRFLAPRRQEDHPVDDRINETPIFACLRRLLQMDTKLSSGDTDSPPYTKLPPSPRLCVSLCFGLIPDTNDDVNTESSRVNRRRHSTSQDVRVLHSSDHLPPRRLQRRRPAPRALGEEHLVLARGPGSQEIQTPPLHWCGGRGGRPGIARLHRGLRPSRRPHRSHPA